MGFRVQAAEVPPPVDEVSRSLFDLGQFLVHFRDSRCGINVAVDELAREAGAFDRFFRQDLADFSEEESNAEPGQSDDADGDEAGDADGEGREQDDADEVDVVVCFLSYSNVFF